MVILLTKQVLKVMMTQLMDAYMGHLAFDSSA